MTKKVEIGSTGGKMGKFLVKWIREINLDIFCQNLSSEFSSG